MRSLLVRVVRSLRVVPVSWNGPPGANRVKRWPIFESFHLLRPVEYSFPSLRVDTFSTDKNHFFGFAKNISRRFRWIVSTWETTLINILLCGRKKNVEVERGDNDDKYSGNECRIFSVLFFFLLFKEDDLWPLPRTLRADKSRGFNSCTICFSRDERVFLPNLSHPIKFLIFCAFSRPLPSYIPPMYCFRETYSDVKYKFLLIIF